MSRPTPAAVAAELAPSSAEPLRLQILTALALHRTATSQLRQMLRPEGSRQLISRALHQQRTAGYVDLTPLHATDRSRTHAWYLTPEGARQTRDHPLLRGRPPCPITTSTAASLKTPHTLTVVRAHLAFAADARRLGHEHGPFDWTREVAHLIGEGERLVADAVCTTPSQAANTAGNCGAFMEIDRTTMSSERLAIKLIDYARLFTYDTQPAGRRKPHTTGPGWQRWYPVFPRVLFILTGATPARLNNRISDLQAMTTQQPLVAALARETPLAAAVLEDLEKHGPSGAVWTLLTGGEPRSWTEL
ncbi:replication-relaxation family protein [Streptomyces sp. NPDC052415]|uniref:replication-relaxation family protein n=1 Tax=Streptomyces sp. NPDC052415 TaxID=3365690 RepID=UPI0037CE74A5